MKYLFVLLFLFSPLVSYARCDYPDDLDSAGRRCGKRAASVRPGGRLGGDGNYNRRQGKKTVYRRVYPNSQSKSRSFNSVGRSVSIMRANRLRSVLLVFQNYKDKWLSVDNVKSKLKNWQKNWPVAELVNMLSENKKLVKSPDGKQFMYVNSQGK